MMENDGDSDYGSDFSIEEADVIVNRLLLSTSETVQLQATSSNTVTGLDCHHDTGQLRVFHSSIVKSTDPYEQFVSIEGSDDDPICIDPNATDLFEGKKWEPPVEHVVDENDNRPPLERFRSKPNKAFSVTDLTAPSWCELQYYYTMKYLGKKKRTPAMKQGSVVHKELEQQIYTTVKVKVTTKEDVWGLRIWNVIQGLRTLQETGHTRELQVWGIVHGEVVTGVIDDITTICPDQELEDEWEAKHKPPLPPDQLTISQFFDKSNRNSSLSSSMKKSPDYRLYICDVKTRAGSTLPQNASFRPAQYQLMVYHNLFSKMITEPLDFSILAERYNLDANRSFSDALIAQIGSLNDDGQAPLDDATFPASSGDSVSVLLANNSLSALWGLMTSTLRTLAPAGRESVGNVLKVEYRSRGTGEVIGSKSFPMDDGVLKRFIDYEMQWWKGEREPRGVDVDDAFKCRSCDFTDTCEWRISMHERLKEEQRNKVKNTAMRSVTTMAESKVRYLSPKE